MALSQERLLRLIAQSTDVVVATDASGHVVYYNDGASEMLGYTSDEIMGAYVSRLYPSPEEAKKVMHAMRDPGYGGEGVVHSFPTYFLSKSGEEIPVAISGTILHKEDGSEDGTIGFGKDLREILRKDQLATLGSLAVGLSHEINNPLAVILNQVELLEHEIEDLAGERDCSVEAERCYALRREVSRISEILGRLGDMVGRDKYQTTEYIGPSRMIDLRPRGPAADPDPRLKGIRILVVDDDPGICRTMKELLEGAGCVVETAGDGAEALERIDAMPFDVVLSDVVMPNMDGYELYMAIREKHPELHVLMMTAFHYDKDHIIKRSRIEGLEGVLFKKPVDPDRLREVLIQTVRGEKPVVGEEPDGGGKPAHST